MEIAYLEKEESEAGSVKQWLEEAGHQYRHAVHAPGLADLLRHQVFDAVLMDWDAPGMSPVETLRAARQYGRGAPVMLASHRSDEASIVEALSSGADEYIIKPLARDELLARLATLNRRVAMGRPAENQGFKIGPWQVDPENREIRMHGKPVRLTEKDFDLACYFFRNIGKLVSRRELFREVWGINTPIQSRTVDVHVSRIRRSLRIDPTQGFRIKTVYQHGYRLERADD